MEQNEKKTIGIWAFKNASEACVFFELKARLEENLGRVLTGNETHDLAKGMQAAGTIKGFELDSLSSIDIDVLKEKLLNILPPKTKREDLK